MSEFRVGIVGAGFGSYGLVPSFRRDDRCKVTAIAASKLETARAVASKLGIPNAFGRWEDLVASKEVDAVAIAVPPMVQPAIALAAFANGKPVFAEKPIAAAIEDAEILLKAAEESGLANVVDFIFPDLVVFSRARDLLEQGGVGSPLHIIAEWIFWSADHRSDVRTWRTDAESGGGGLAHYGSHMIYYLQWFLGRIVSVSGHTIRPPGYQNTGDTGATLTLSFENGATATLVVSSGSPIAARHSVTILGTEGALVLSNETESPINGFKLEHYRAGKLVGEPLVEPEEEGIDCRVPAAGRIARRFVDWATTGRKTRPSFQDGLEVQRIIETVIQSRTI